MVRAFGVRNSSRCCALNASLSGHSSTALDHIASEAGSAFSVQFSVSESASRISDYEEYEPHKGDYTHFFPLAEFLASCDQNRNR